MLTVRSVVKVVNATSRHLSRLWIQFSGVTLFSSQTSKYAMWPTWNTSTRCSLERSTTSVGPALCRPSDNDDDDAVETAGAERPAPATSPSPCCCRHQDAINREIVHQSKFLLMVSFTSCFTHETYAFLKLHIFPFPLYYFREKYIVIFSGFILWRGNEWRYSGITWNAVTHVSASIKPHAPIAGLKN